MARRYRIESSDKKVLEALARERGGQVDVDSLLDEIESTGNLSQETRARLATQPSKGILPLLEQIIGGLPSKRQAYETYLGQTDIGQEPVLTDVELQERLGLYRGLGEKESIDVSGIRQQRKQELKDIIKRAWRQIPDIREVEPKGFEDAPEKLAEMVANGQISSSNIGSIFNITRSVLDPYIQRLYSGGNKGGDKRSELSNHIANTIKDQILSRENYFKVQDLPSSKDYTPDISRVQDILSSRGLKRQREEELSQFETGLESELSRGREEFLKGEQAYGQQYFEQELAPRIAEGLNVRGLLYSGDLASELARSASGVQSGIEQEYLKLQEEDDMFFQNAAYQTTFRKEIEAGRGISEQLGYERGKAREQQQISFGRTQADLRRRYEEESYRRDLERQARSQEARLRTQRDYTEQQQKDRLLGDIGTTAGQIGGTIIGSRLGSPTVESKGVVSG